MVTDIRRVLGDAPQEEVTTGTAGRVSEADRSAESLVGGIGNLAKMGADWLAGKREAKAEADTAEIYAKAADLSVGSTLGVPPELVAEMDQVTGKISQARAQGQNSTRIAVTRGLAMRKMLAQYPQYAETITKAFNDTGPEVATELAAVAKQQDQLEMANYNAALDNSRKVLIAKGINIANMTDDDLFARMQQFEANIQQVTAAQDRLAVIEADEKLNEAQKRTQRNSVIDSTVNVLLENMSVEAETIMNDPDSDLDMKNAALADRFTRMEVELRKNFNYMPNSEFEQKFGAFLTMKQLYQDRASGKFDGVELAALENRSKTLLAAAELGFYTSNPQAVELKVRIDSVNNALRLLPPWEQSRLASDAVRMVTQDVFTLGNPNASVLNGTGVTDRNGQVLVAPDKGIEVVKSLLLNTAQGLKDADITPEFQKQAAASYTRLLNEYTQQGNNKALNALVDTLAAPDVYTRVMNPRERLTEEFSNRAKPLVRDYVDNSFKNAASRLEAAPDQYTLSFDNKGLPVLTPSATFTGRQSELKKEEAMLRRSVQAYTHMFLGNSDYQAGSRQILERME